MWHSYFVALGCLAGFAVAGWLISIKAKNVTIVDSMWALFFLIATAVHISQVGNPTPRAWLVLLLVATWAIRLSGYLHWRNHGKTEDARYQAIRARNQPNFAIKSLYLVFLLQVMLAWIISLPLIASTFSYLPLNAWDALGLALWMIGMTFQVTGDWQLARFKANADNKGKVLDTGVWRYTRHPNYFGEACIWWGYFALALAASAWWSVISPIFMTFLLLKVTGVKLLEADIAQRRPDYADYIRRTSAFFPTFPKAK